MPQGESTEKAPKLFFFLDKKLVLLDITSIGI